MLFHQTAETDYYMPAENHSMKLMFIISATVNCTVTTTALEIDHEFTYATIKDNRNDAR